MWDIFGVGEREKKKEIKSERERERERKRERWMGVKFYCRKILLSKLNYCRQLFPNMQVGKLSDQSFSTGGSSTSAPSFVLSVKLFETIALIQLSAIIAIYA